MQRSAVILGLPVIDISEGSEIGIATRIVIDPTERCIAALVIDDGQWYLGAKLLPFAAIAGLGESAITIISKNSIMPIENAPALKQLLCADIAIIGTKVLTKAGQMQGTAKEIMIDTAGNIVACEIEEVSGEIKNIPIERILTFGKKVIIIADEPQSIITTTKVATFQQLSIPETEVSTTISEVNNDDFGKRTDDKQRRNLLGKHASRRIETNNGVVIVEQGEEISEAVLQKAKLAGKFAELSINIQ